MSRRNITFKVLSEELTNKDKAIKNFITYWLDKTQSMFTYTNLPTTIPQDILESYLQKNGSCGFTQYENEWYVFDGATGGEEDIYHRPTQYIISNPCVKESLTLTIDKDVVVIDNDTHKHGLLPLLSEYGALLVENKISIRSALVNLRVQTIISSPDDNTKASADLFIQNIEDGKLSTIAENGFLDGIRVYNSGTNTNYLTQLIETQQYIKASLYNELGLNSNYNMKREYIGKEENVLNDDILLPFCDNMLECRRNALEKINAMFGLNIEVDYSSSWKANKTELEKQISTNSSQLEVEDVEVVEEEPTVEVVEDEVVEDEVVEDEVVEDEVVEVVEDEVVEDETVEVVEDETVEVVEDETVEVVEDETQEDEEDKEE